MLALGTIELDRPEITARILPRNMPPENFHNMLLREMDRRHAFGQYVLSSTVPPRPGEENRLVQNDALDDVLRFVRPTLTLGGGSVSTGERREQNATPGDVALYDAATTSVLFERYQRPDRTTGQPANPEFVLSPDVVAALNLPPAPDGRAYGSGPLTDVRRRTLGYAFASVDAFNPLHSNGPLTVLLTPSKPDGTPLIFSELQDNYCRMVRGMYAAGEQENPRDAFLSGFIQARADARNAPSARPTNGVTGECRAKP